VGSSVARLEKHEKNASVGESVRKTFHFLTKKAFEHRRKQLGSIFKDMIQSTARAEELSNEQWIILSKGLTDENT
jgi:16S rRNA A1518/A1519 N6-dimethyltransferase RsmA/KsgA/DIM1 with predicted DNA glycosylase/AP lyase activity